MKATSRASAPHSPAMIIIAVAPPGQQPQMLVDAGIAPVRAIVQPSALAAASIEKTAARKTGQS